MNPAEARSTQIIGIVLATRLLGIFLILPVFSPYVIDYPGSSHFLAGLAFGMYALTQAALQIPFGRASDRFGRKPVIVAGLMIFCAGSIWCGLADGIWELIAARSLQGCGAVGSVAIAALGDSTRPQVRGQCFAVTGIIIGASFMVSIVAGPALVSWIDFQGLFYITAALGAAAAVITLLFFPETEKMPERSREGVLSVLRRRGARKILLGAFFLSSVLSIFLFVFPLNWEESAGREISRIWTAYLAALAPAALITYPFVKLMEKRGTMNIPPSVAMVLLGAGTAAAMASGGKAGMIAAGAAFFLGHSIFQTLLPTFLTSIVPEGERGNASGFLNLAGFSGAFAGSALAGLLYAAGAGAALALCLALIAIWFFAGAPEPPEAEADKA